MLVGTRDLTSVSQSAARAEQAKALRISRIREPHLRPEKKVTYAYEAQRPWRNGTHLVTPRGRDMGLSFGQAQLLELEQHGSKVRITNPIPKVEIYVNDPADIRQAQAEGRQPVQIIQRVDLGNSLLPLNEQIAALQASISQLALDNTATRDALRHAITGLIKRINALDSSDTSSDPGDAQTMISATTAVSNVIQVVPDLLPPIPDGASFDDMFDGGDPRVPSELLLSIQAKEMQKLGNISPYTQGTVKSIPFSGDGGATRYLLDITSAYKALKKKPYAWSSAANAFVPKNSLPVYVDTSNVASSSGPSGSGSRLRYGRKR